jgi:hypothetical protein
MEPGVILMQIKLGVMTTKLSLLPNQKTLKFQTRARWVTPKSCTPPHRITHPEKFVELSRQFSTQGWDINHPALIGYQLEKIQLISGSHRWAAALKADIKIPVILYPYSKIRAIWGTDEWLALLNQTTYQAYLV